MGKRSHFRMEKMRVALVMPNHAEMHSSLNNYIKTYQYLIRKGSIKLTLFTDQKNSIAIDGVHIKKIHGYDYGTLISKIFFFLGIPRFYYKNLDEELKGYDVIVSNNPEFYGYAYQAYRAARARGVRFILRTSQTVDGFFLYHLTKYIVNPWVKPAYDYASSLIFSNPQAQERCIRLNLMNKEKRSVISGHAIDETIFKPKKTKKPSFPVILSVGGLYKLKGHQYIVEALSKVHQQYPEAQLWIVGQGEYQIQLEKLSSCLGVGGQVKFLGNQDHHKLARLYCLAHVFVLANEQEITPAVNEALACQTPVVAMDCGGRSFVIPDESYGLIAKRFDVDDIASKITTILNDNVLAKRISEKGRKRVIDQFTISAVAQKFYKAFTR